MSPVFYMVRKILNFVQYFSQVFVGAVRRLLLLTKVIMAMPIQAILTPTDGKAP